MLEDRITLKSVKMTEPRFFAALRAVGPGALGSAAAGAAGGGGKETGGGAFKETALVRSLKENESAFVSSERPPAIEDGSGVNDEFLNPFFFWPPVRVVGACPLEPVRVQVVGLGSSTLLNASELLLARAVNPSSCPKEEPQLRNLRDLSSAVLAT